MILLPSNVINISQVFVALYALYAGVRALGIDLRMPYRNSLPAKLAQIVIAIAGIIVLLNMLGGCPMVADCAVGSKERNAVTIEGMKKLVQQHADLESKHDLEGVLATLVENPVYEIYPAGLKLQGKENVRAFYCEHFDSFFPLITSFKLINEWWTPESACMEYDLSLKAPYAEKPYRILVVLTAKNNLLLGERFYISEELAQIMSGTAFGLWKKS